MIRRGTTVTSTLQLASLPTTTFTSDEQKTLKRLKTDEDIVILPVDKGPQNGRRC